MCRCWRGISSIYEVNARLYPNPSSGTLNYDFTRTKPVNVAVYNSLGQKVIEVNNVSLGKLELNTGIYFVAVRDEKNNRVVRKVVKM